ncbi:MAG: M20/M25/M40 family metallo-hydrolase [Myxococcota bacterium]
MAPRFVQPSADPATLAARGTDLLTRIVAVDSQSDESSDAIPSSEGQRELSRLLAGFFEGLGYETTADDHANLVVRVPSNLPEGRSAPTVALLAHLDTAEGTLAVPELCVVEGWDGGRIPYPDNDRLVVSADRYPATRAFVGEDVLHGPGVAPVGFDDKLGAAEMMTLATILAEDASIPHGELRLVFRPDEEIGRMAAVEGLADTLRDEGVTFGYTVDGIEPFEVNTANFHASRAVVTVPGRGLDLPPAPVARRVVLSVAGVKSHGATAKAEGYLNPTVVLVRAMDRLTGGPDVVPVGMDSDSLDETDARLTFLVRGDSEAAADEAEAALVEAFDAELSRHAWRGAGVEVLSREEAPADGQGETDAMARVVEHLRRFLAEPDVTPLLSEDSEGWEGYSNPHFVSTQSGGRACLVRYRLRDFGAGDLARREDHVRRVAEAAELPVEVEAQYANMGPALDEHPEVPRYAERAAEAMGEEARRLPIRGGTGVDPFLERGIPVANLGTGYFAPESEKELTSKQILARHALWLVYLVQAIAQSH